MRLRASWRTAAPITASVQVIMATLRFRCCKSSFAPSGTRSTFAEFILPERKRYETIVHDAGMTVQ
jgi:hypothetical protein